MSMHPGFPNDVDELSIHEPSTGGAPVVVDEEEDDQELIELEAEAAMMVDVDDDPGADDEAMGDISPKGEEENANFMARTGHTYFDF